MAKLMTIKTRFIKAKTLETKPVTIRRKLTKIMTAKSFPVGRLVKVVNSERGEQVARITHHSITTRPDGNHIFVRLEKVA